MDFKIIADQGPTAQSRDLWSDEIRIHNIQFKGGDEAAPDDGGQGPQDQPHLQGYSTQVLQYR